VNNGGQHNRDFFSRYNRLRIRLEESEKSTETARYEGREPGMMVHFTGAESVSGDSVFMGWFQTHWTTAVFGQAGKLNASAMLG